MKITSKGQITIPISIRESLGLLPGVDIDFEIEGNTVRIVRNSSDNNDGRGRRVVNRLRGRATVKMSTDEIMALTRK
jgi:AbrB family looped-hinge helix DNA binding protein